uniref:Uncharacterized protein n=1 Tax=Triticum urartu TaxID=4572 RepID=A0A8R7UEI3_TRIUA
KKARSVRRRWEEGDENGAQLDLDTTAGGGTQLTRSNASTRPYDHFDPREDRWIDVVGEPGGILQNTEAQLDALRAAQGLIAASQQFHTASL